MEHFLRLFTEKSTRKALLSKDFLLWWFTSPDVAPILARFAEALKDWEDDLSLHFAGQDQLSDAVQTKDAELLASCAKSLPLIETGTNTFDHEYRGAILMCAMYVRLLAEGSKACIMCFLDPQHVSGYRALSVRVLRQNSDHGLLRSGPNQERILLHSSWERLC